MPCTTEQSYICPPKYVCKALPVGDEHRFYLAGGSQEYRKSEVLGVQLRDPLLVVMSPQYEFEQVGEAVVRP